MVAAVVVAGVVVVAVVVAAVVVAAVVVAAVVVAGVGLHTNINLHPHPTLVSARVTVTLAPATDTLNTALG